MKIALMLALLCILLAPRCSAQSRPAAGKSQKVSNPLNDLLDQAQLAIDKKDFSAAIPPLQKFLAEKPEVAYAHFQLGYVYTALNRPDDARTEFQAAIDRDPKMPEASLNLGLLLIDRDPAASVVALRRVVELLPAQSHPRFLLGVALEHAGDKPGAIDSLTAALRLDPRDLDARLRLAALFTSLQRPAEAESSYRAALEIDPNNSPAMLGLAQSLETQKKPEASEAYDKYFADHPEAGTPDRKVRELIAAQQFDQAAAELDRLTAGKPANLGALRMRADIQIGQKDLAGAVATLRQALTMAPGDAQLHGGLGRILLQQRDFPAAEKELKSAIQIDPRNTVYWKDLSSTYYLGGDCPATIATLDQISKMEAPTVGSWFIRGLCLDKLQQIKPAYDAYQKFLELDQNQNADQVWQAQQRSKILKRLLERKH